MAMPRNPHPDVADLVVDRLGELVDKLHQEARVLAPPGFRKEERAMLRSAGDYISELRKEVQRS